MHKIVSYDKAHLGAILGFSVNGGGGAIIVVIMSFRSNSL